MAKYVIDIPDEKIYAYVNEDKTFLRVPISAGENNIKSVFAPTMLRITPYTEPDEQEIRQKVEDEVWDFASQLDELSGDNWEKVFGVSYHKSRMRTMTYQKARAKYDAWKAEKEQIRVGDEVVIDYDKTAVVLWLNEYGNVGGYVYSDGKAYINGTGITSFKKTGRHFPEVAELLKKMREE